MITESEYLNEIANLWNADKIIDNNAPTRFELGKKWGIKRSATRDRIRQLIDDGKLEMVWKYVDGKLTPAYRVKK